MKLLSADLNDAAITKMTTALETDANDCTVLIGALDEFIRTIETKESLDGISYLAVKTKLNEYKNIISTRKQIATTLQSAISGAVSQMKAYISPYTELDDADLGMLKQSVDNALAEISRLEKALEDNDNNEDTSGYTARISQLREETIYIKKQIEKIEGLAAADSAAFGQISSAGDSISRYRSSVNGMGSIQVNTV